MNDARRANDNDNENANDNMIDHLPTNPSILVSTVHTLLRDREFDNLRDLCGYYDCCYHELQHTVAETETAAVVGSGLLPVYATPQVVALMEKTACALIANLPADAEGALTDGDTTVGTRMVIDHVKACGVGSVVSATAMLVGVDGRAYSFLIEVTNDRGEVLAKAEHTRFRVNSERFMAKLNG